MQQKPSRAECEDRVAANTFGSNSLHHCTCACAQLYGQFLDWLCLPTWSLSFRPTVCKWAHLFTIFRNRSSRDDRSGTQSGTDGKAQRATCRSWAVQSESADVWRNEKNTTEFKFKCSGWDITGHNSQWMSRGLRMFPAGAVGHSTELLLQSSCRSIWCIW